MWAMRQSSSASVFCSFTMLDTSYLIRGSTIIMVILTWYFLSTQSASQLYQHTFYKKLVRQASILIALGIPDSCFQHTNILYTSGSSIKEHHPVPAHRSKICCNNSVCKEELMFFFPCLRCNIPFWMDAAAAGQFSVPRIWDYTWGSWIYWSSWHRHKGLFSPVLYFGALFSFLVSWRLQYFNPSS